MSGKKIAVMQPYIFPYIGYFQLIYSVDSFVFYDDVNYIKKGWINRNRVLNQGEAKIFTIPVLKASQNKLIKEILVAYDEKWLNQFTNMLTHCYKKAPYFEEVMILINNVFVEKVETISDIAIRSIEEICNYLDIKTELIISSEKFSETIRLERADRLIEITKQCQGSRYINPAGGADLYTKEYFKSEGIELNFIKNELPAYRQFNNNFLGGLSIIDALMFNSKKDVLKMLNLYELN